MTEEKLITRIESLIDRMYELGYEGGYDACKQGQDSSDKYAEALANAKETWISEFTNESSYESGYTKGMNDAWRYAESICNNYTKRSLIDLGFNNVPGGADVYDEFEYSAKVISSYSAEEAITKIKEYEDSRIREGDEIVSILGSRVIITSIGSQTGDWSCIDKYGCACVLTSEQIKAYSWHKTGRHFSQVTDLLDKIKEIDSDDN